MASTPMRYRAAPPARLDARSDRRHAIAIARASVRPHGRWPAEATLVDLSAYGARLASPLPHAAGERVWLRLAGGMPVAAEVVWAADGAIGCRFDAPIETARVRAMVLTA